MRSQVRIDAMTEGDIATVCAVCAPDEMRPEDLAAEMQRPWSRQWVARDDGGDAVAFVIAWHVADELHVLNVATREDRRRSGIARTLMAEVIAYARSQRIRHVLLEVRRSNRAAIALYRGEGFSTMGIRSRYYPDDEDALEMVVRLDPTTGDILPGGDGPLES